MTSSQLTVVFDALFPEIEKKDERKNAQIIKSQSGKRL